MGAERADDRVSVEAQSQSSALGVALAYAVAALEHAHARLEALDVGYLAPCFESSLERDHSGLRKRDFNGFQHFLGASAVPHRGVNVALDVPFPGAHGRQRRAEEQLLSLAVKQTFTSVDRADKLIRRSQRIEVSLSHTLVEVQHVAALLRHVVDVCLFLVLRRHGAAPFSSVRPPDVSGTGR